MNGSIATGAWSGDLSLYPEIVICGDGLNLSRTEYAVWLDHIHSAPSHIITVSSIGREFSTASLLLNWRREMELMAIMNHLSCLLSAFPLNYTARRTLPTLGSTDAVLCNILKHGRLYRSTSMTCRRFPETWLFLQLYKRGLQVSKILQSFLPHYKRSCLYPWSYVKSYK